MFRCIFNGRLGVNLGVGLYALNEIVSFVKTSIDNPHGEHILPLKF